MKLGVWLHFPEIRAGIIPRQPLMMFPRIEKEVSTFLNPLGEIFFGRTCERRSKPPEVTTPFSFALTKKNTVILILRIHRSWALHSDTLIKMMQYLARIRFDISLVLMPGFWLLIGAIRKIGARQYLTFHVNLPVSLIFFLSLNYCWLLLPFSFFPGVT